MGLGVQLVKLACPAVLVGLLVAWVWAWGPAVFIGVFVYWVLISLFVGGGGIRGVD